MTLNVKNIFLQLISCVILVSCLLDLAGYCKRFYDCTSAGRFSI